MEEIIEIIESQRREKKISKRELSGMVGISEEYYWRILRGKANGCSWVIINKLLRAVDIETMHYKSIMG